MRTCHSSPSMKFSNAGVAAICSATCSALHAVPEKSASFSGISGVQPKVLVRDEKTFAEMEHTGERLSQSYKGATHIVKLWERNEYPQLAANEFFCLSAARKCGLDVPPFRLAEDGNGAGHRPFRSADGRDLTGIRGFLRTERPQD